VDAVEANAEAILAATEAGDMPCDGAWPVERVEMLRGWIEGGVQPWVGPNAPNCVDAEAFVVRRSEVSPGCSCDGRTGLGPGAPRAA